VGQEMSENTRYYFRGRNDIYAYVSEEDFKTLQAERDKYKAALEKIADPRLRDHKEPDAYTELCCVMHIAAEALE
jgi:hypothetical protein